MNIIFVCAECGKPPAEDKEKSNNNWKVYESKCNHCGGKIKAIVK